MHLLNVDTASLFFTSFAHVHVHVHAHAHASLRLFFFDVYSGIFHVTGMLEACANESNSPIPNKL
jgi:hypothetical protein